jgi:acyl-CoA synthetase (AMP-forming)/AMP-acid ligase II
MTLLSRSILNPQLVIRVFTDTDPKNPTLSSDIPYATIIEQINRAKTYLIKERNARPGQKVLLAASAWPSYVIWFIAVAELGMSFVVSDYPFINSSQSVENKLSLYGDIQQVIGDPESEVVTEIPFSHNLIDFSITRTYTDDSCADVMWATPDSIMIYSTSSGTTDTPKVIPTTQKFLYDLLERNAKLYDLKTSDICLHTKGLHHGSVTGVYFLPTIKYCSTHYFARFHDNLPDCPVNWVDLVQSKKINRCLMFYTMLDQFTALASLENKQHDDLTIFVLNRIKPANIERVVGEFGYRIFSIFGCTETTGPLLLPGITPENYTLYEHDNFGKQLDDFYQLSVTPEGMLSVIMPDGSSVLTGDKFSLINGNYIFNGRENLYRIRGVPVYVNLLVEVITQVTNLVHTEDYDIVVDKQYEKIYIRINDDIDLEYVNSQILDIIKIDSYLITLKIIADRAMFFNGIKFDAEEVRLVCRTIYPDQMPLPRAKELAKNAGDKKFLWKNRCCLSGA